MMSLVAYGSSGESENESDNEKESTNNDRNESPVSLSRKGESTVTQSPSLSHSVNTSKEAPAVVPSVRRTKTDLHSKLPPPKTAVAPVEDAELEEGLEINRKLPAPKHHTTPSLLGSSLVLPHDSKTKGKKGTVKIMIPSLADFPEDEDEPRTKKKVQPSAKGSGLFALLPPPKQAPVKETNRLLVPNILTRKPAPAPSVKKVLSKPASQALKRKQPDSDPESDGEGDGVDFFSLNKEDELPEIPMAEVALEYQSTTANNVPSSSSHYNPVAIDYQYQQLDENHEQTAIPQADSGQDFISFSNSADLELDDEALKKLCGRKGRNREEIQIVDVSGDSIMPDQREWLTKQLTEEQPRPSSKSKLYGPSSQQKRKHQITYLAHIAKENELELKNQWANNRQTRKQTQSKYGF